jgi:hypothetical protein
MQNNSAEAGDPDLLANGLNCRQILTGADLKATPRLAPIRGSQYEAGITGHKSTIRRDKVSGPHARSAHNSKRFPQACVTAPKSDAVFAQQIYAQSIRGCRIPWKTSVKFLRERDTGRCKKEQ